MPKVNINVNGQDLSAEVEERQLLVHFLRDDMDLTGTHVGCDTSQCGACVVHLEGKAVKSCTMLAVVSINLCPICASFPPTFASTLYLRSVPSETSINSTLAVPLAKPAAPPAPSPVKV